jgi:outer membrane usher protein
MILRSGKWLLRFAPAVIGGFLTEAGAGGNLAHAQSYLPPFEHPQPDTPPINPTSRVLEMAVPLNYRDFYLGDLEVRITPEQQVLVPHKALLAAVKPLLRETAFEVLSAAITADASADTHVDLTAVKAAGFDFRFDPGAVSIIFDPTFEQKVEGNISVQARRATQVSPNAANAARLAAFLNMRLATDYIGMSPGGREGLRAPRLDLEAAARWKGTVIEAEATFEPDDNSIFGETGQGFKRRGTRLVRDFEDDALRMSVGDIYAPGAGFQNTPDLLGVSVERSYAKLQPGRNIRPTSRRSFRIERPSNVDVQINGITERRLKLDPGDYNLSDLPVRSGLNEITLLIEDDAGGRERLEFSVFRDNDLLEQGLSEWGFAAGVLSTFDQGEPDYGGADMFATGYYRQGLSEDVTGELYLQGNEIYALGGGSLLFGSTIGMFAIEGAASMSDGELWGGALEAYYSPVTLTDNQGRDHDLRLSARGQSEDFTASLPSKSAGGEIAKPSHERWLDLAASYRTQLPLHISAFVSGGYGFGLDPDKDQFHTDVGFNRAFGSDVSVGVSAGYSGAYDTEDEDEISLLFRMHYRPDQRSSLGLSYDPADHRARASYSQHEGRGLGSWQFNGELSHEADGTRDYDPMWSTYSLDGSITYTGNRGQVALFQQSRLAGLDAAELDQRTSLRIETGLAFADGTFALGRPVADGFAIVTPHAGLADREITIGRKETGLIAKSDIWGPALIPSVTPYALSRIDYDVDDLPPGYDLGDGLFDLQAKYRSGYVLEVGSAYTVIAIGTLRGANGEPLALLTGVAVEVAKPDRKVELFTNRSGRFAAQGLSPGQWMIEMASDPPQRFSLDIPQSSLGLVRVGEIAPITEGMK